MPLTVDPQPDGSIQVGGELDLASAPLLRSALQTRIDAAADDVILDVGGLSFCDSSGLSVLVWGHQTLLAAGGKLILRHAPERLLRLLRTTQLDSELNLQ
jgi:anti-sigma B factor antagonist